MFTKEQQKQYDELAAESRAAFMKFADVIPHGKKFSADAIILAGEYAAIRSKAHAFYVRCLYGVGP